jgi:fucose 4-O-acetylase-like acetyltransferase
VTDAAASAAVKSTRVPLWDNARWACVTLVVIGHAIQRMTYDSDNAYAVYILVYAFHMPAFAIISGYFSKAGAPSTKQMRKVLTDILLPYLVMEIIWTLVQFVFEGKRDFNPTEPSWTLWFLLALGIFRLVLPYLVLLRAPLVWAVVASVAVGYFANVDSTFSLSRAIGILPFFLLGWKLRQWKLIDRWRFVDQQTWWIRLAAVAVFAASALCAWAFVAPLHEFGLAQWFYYDYSYGELAAPEWWAGLLRLGLMALAVVLTAAFFVLIPRHESWITPFGQSTMYVYLLHSFILYPIRESGILRGDNSAWYWLLTAIVVSVLISILLSTRFVRRIFHPLIEPKPRWLFVPTDDDEDPSPSPSRTDPPGSRRN